MKFVVHLVTLPLLAQQGSNLYSLEKERTLGQQFASEVRRQSEPLGDPLVRDYVDRVGRQLSSGLNDRRLEYHFEVISDSNRREPFALPGGYVFIPARIFASTRDEHEFVGTVAHAMAHAALRHGTRTASLGKMANMASIPVVFMGGWNGSHADSHNPQVLVPVSLLESQRTYELEADRFGLELAARTGYDASAFLRYVERTHTADSKQSPVPERDVRIARIRETLASLPESASFVSGEFRSVQERVRLVFERPQGSRVPTLKR